MKFCVALQVGGPGIPPSGNGEKSRRGIQDLKQQKIVKKICFTTDLISANCNWSILIDLPMVGRQHIFLERTEPFSLIILLYNGL